MTALLTFLWTGQRPATAPLTDVDLYTRILTTPAPADARRGHRLTQPGDPRRAAQWIEVSYHYHATAPLVAHDERFLKETP